MTLLTPLKLLSFPSYDHTPAAIFRRHCFPWHNIYSEICNILTPLSQLECSSNSIVIGNQCTTILLLCGSHITTLYHPPSLHHPLSLHHPPSITLSLSITLPLSPSLSPSPSLYHPLSLHHPPSITLSLSITLPLSPSLSPSPSLCHPLYITPSHPFDIISIQCITTPVPVILIFFIAFGNCHQPIFMFVY